MSQEYRTDIEYMAAYNAAQTPARINYVAALNNIPSPSLSNGYRYCDLGCGAGATVLVLAAAMPEAEFWGIDLNPSHIRMAQARAEKLGLTNAHFVEANISSLAERPDLRDFDCIAINGLFSWLTAERRGQAMDFLRDALKPGGFAYIHYMTDPGNIVQEPICRLIRRFYEGTAGDVEQRVVLTKQFLKGFAETQQQYLTAFPTSKAFIEMVLKCSPEVFLHDFLAEERHAFYFEDMYREMSSRGFGYVGCADFMMNHLQLCVQPEAQRLFQGVKDRDEIEQIKDFAMVAPGRKDIYIRSPVSATGGQDYFLEQSFAVVALKDLDKGVQFPGCVVPTNTSPYVELQKILSTKAMSWAEISQLPELAAYSQIDLRRAIQHLVAASKVEPCAIPTPEEGASVTDGNRIILEQAVLHGSPASQPVVVLSSPVLAGGLNLSWYDATMALGLLQQPKNGLINWVLDIFKPRNLAFKCEGVPTQGPESTRKYLMQQLPGIHTSLQALFVRFGIGQLPDLPANWQR